METEELVIIEHPMMYERHVVARIVGATKSMVNVVYWKDGRAEWSDETKRRKAESVVKRLGDASAFSESDIKRVSSRLASFAAERDRRTREALASYHKAVADVSVTP